MCLCPPALSPYYPTYTWLLLTADHVALNNRRVYQQLFADARHCWYVSNTAQVVISNLLHVSATATQHSSAQKGYDLH
jgi:hypothetical protein